MIVTLSLHRHDTLASRLWAFAQMGLARRPLKRVPGLRSWKLMGTGAGDGFSTRPNHTNQRDRKADLGSYHALPDRTWTQPRRSGRQ
jgi:hypothetical protein